VTWPRRFLFLDGVPTSQSSKASGNTAYQKKVIKPLMKLFAVNAIRTTT
jgi:hypothetical protein